LFLLFSLRARGLEARASVLVGLPHGAWGFAFCLRWRRASGKKAETRIGWLLAPT